MSRSTDNKIILVTRPTRLDELIVRFNTAAQARFYLEHLGADFSDYLREAECYRHALIDTQQMLSTLGRLQTVDRSFLPNFLFGPSDTIVILGQDGLVANTLKYLNRQPVIGVNPEPDRWDGQLLPFQVHDLVKVIPEVFEHRRPTRSVTMAKATLNDGQIMYAVNDLFIGPKSHGSARYTLRLGENEERQSSSGVIVSTGLGSTGWLKSLLAGATGIAQAAATVLRSGPPPVIQQRDAKSKQALPWAITNMTAALPWDAEHLYFTVREPFPSKTTTTSLLFGKITSQTPLMVASQTAENGVIFSDGIEKDFLQFNSGTQAEITVADRKGTLVV